MTPGGQGPPLGGTHLVVLDLAAHHPEGVVPGVVVDVDAAEASGAARRDPLLVGVVVDHDGRPRLADTLLTVGGDRKQEGVRGSSLWGGQETGRG